MFFYASHRTTLPSAQCSADDETYNSIRPKANKTKHTHTHSVETRRRCGIVAYKFSSSRPTTECRLVASSDTFRILYVCEIIRQWNVDFPDDDPIFCTRTQSFESPIRWCLRLNRANTLKFSFASYEYLLWRRQACSWVSLLYSGVLFWYFPPFS